MLLVTRLLFALLCLAGCGGSSRIPAQEVLVHGDARVGTYVSSPRGFSTSSYWIEGPEGLVLIDTQFMLSAAEELVDWAERSTGKPVVLAIVLHANPDKFNGTEVMKRRGIPVITSEQVRALIPSVHAIRHRSFYARYQPDYPNDYTLPDSFGSETREMAVAGLTLKLHVMGAGCSEAHVAVEFDGHLFVGDLVASGAHSWLEIGKTDEWLRRIDELEALHPRFVHPGRGASGGPELLVGERAYLNRVIEIVRASNPSGEMPEGALDALSAQVEGAYPGYGFAVFLRIGLPAEYRRQALLAPH